MRRKFGQSHSLHDVGMMPTFVALVWLCAVVVATNHIPNSRVPKRSKADMAVAMVPMIMFPCGVKSPDGQRPKGPLNVCLTMQM